MGKIKRSTAQIKEGINSNPSGTTNFLRFPRSGVILGAKAPIKVKRPRQYNKKPKAEKQK